jgi:hypothetical protein
MFALAVGAIAYSAEPVAGYIKQWREGLDDSQAGLKGNLEILERFVDGLSMTGSKIKSSLAVTAKEMGFDGVGRWIGGDPDGDRRKAAAEAAREAIGKVSGSMDEERRKAVLSVMQEMGGGKAFADVLTAGLGKDERESMLGMIGKAMGGDETAFEGLRGRFNTVGRPDAAFGLVTAMPSHQREAAEQRRKMEEGAALQAKQAADRERDAAKEAEASADFFRDFGKWSERQDDQAEKNRRTVIANNAADWAANDRDAEKAARRFVGAGQLDAPKILDGPMAFINSMQTAGAQRPAEEQTAHLRDIKELMRRQLELAENADERGWIVGP